jgi:hypothetical protein
MDWTGRKPTKEELLEDYARHEPQTLLQFDGQVFEYGNAADGDGHLVTTSLSHELSKISGVRVYIASDVRGQDAAMLLRKIAYLVGDEGMLQKIYKSLTSPPKPPAATSPTNQFPV